MTGSDYKALTKAFASFARLGMCSRDALTFVAGRWMHEIPEGEDSWVVFANRALMEYHEKAEKEGWWEKSFTGLKKAILRSNKPQ